MKKRLFAAFVSLCMIVSMLPTTAFAEAGAQDSNLITDTSGLCEHHTEHTADCGYTGGTAEIPCFHEHMGDCYTLVTECVHEHTAECYPAESVSENTATPSEPEEAEPTACTHECSEESGCITKALDCKHEHDEACGYVPATEGTPCTYVCEVCNPQDSGNPATPSDAQPEECTCETLCTREEINVDCPVCSAEGAELDKVCTGAAPMLTAAAPLTGEHTNHNGWTELSGTINDSTLSAGNYVLTGDVTLNQNVAFGKEKEENVSTVICLNGHTIDGQNYSIIKASSKDVTICDCTGSGKIRNATLNNISNLNNIKLTGCTISNDPGALQLTLNGVDVSGGTITSVAGCNLYINTGTSISSSTVLEGFNVYINDGSVDCDFSVAGISVYISGGTVRGSVGVFGGTSGSGILDTPGILNISGGTVSGPISIEGRGTCNITGGTITAPITVNEEGTCNITGGTITTKNTTESGETTGAVIVKSGSCNIGGDAQISGCRIDNGGAVSVLGGNCTISGNNIHNNTTKDGGVYVKGGTCTIDDDAVISANTATNAGAGVHIDGGTCNIDGTITGNTARYAANGHGGGVYISAGECNIYGTVTKNTATVNGGGVYAAGGICTIYGTVTKNTATVNGGGVYAAGGICTIYGSIEENTAVNGGGVYVEPGAQVNTRNASSGLSRITNNTASEYGGGVYLSEGTKWDNVCDITRNRAQAGGGIYAVEGCHLTIRVGSISYNVAQDRGGGLYIGDSSASPCIVNITNWVIKNNQDRYLNPDNIVSLNSKITYEPASSAQDTLPYDEPGSIMLRNDASFTILDGKHKVDDAISCFDIQDNNKILIAGGFYDKDPAQEPTLTVLDNVKVIKLDGDIGYDQYDPDYPWAVYAVKDGLTGTANSPVYDGQPIENNTDFKLNMGNDIQKFYYWHKAQRAEDGSYVAGLPSNAGDYTIKVGGLHLRTSGEEWYAECTFDLTIAKADPSYTVPTGITAQVGKPLSNVTLPKGWTWTDGNTIPQTEGTQTYPAIFTPDDTANYNTVETDISVEVVKEPVVQEYAITFDANGGSVSSSSAQTKNGKLESLPTPTRGGYDFLGWYTQKDGGDEVTTDTVFTKNTTIYAHWQKQTAQEYTVTFDANGGNVSIASAQTKNGKLESLPTPTYDGYDFLGWYTQKDGGEKVTTETVFTADTTIYAHWQEQTAREYTVIFDANGGSVSTASATTKNGKLESLPTPTRGGYTFLGWYTQKDGGDEVTTNTEFIADTTIYAHWQEQAAQEYTVIFDANGGSVSTASATTNDGKLESLPTPTYDGYTFLGWYTQKDGGDKVTTNTVFTKDTTIYAHWQKQAAQEYTVTFDANGGNVEPTSATTKGGKLESLPTPTYDGYTFLGWYTDKDDGDEVTTNTVFTKDTTIYAHWQKQAAQEYTVTFDANGGSVEPSDATTKNGKLENLPTPTRNGYDFLGWYTDKDDGDEVTTETVFTKDTTIYAHWQKENSSSGGGGGSSSGYDYYTITASAGTGGSISPSGSVSVREDTDKTFTMIPDSGWHISDVLIDGKSVGAVTSYTFKDVQKKHTIKAVFAKDNPDTGVDNPFTDVHPDDWFYDHVMYVCHNGLMNGTSATTFSPNDATTRAQIAAIFYRMAGNPAVDGKNSFTDVPYGPGTAWYYDAVTWAQQNGILAGYEDGTFHPDDPITREQLAMVFYNYAKFKGYNITADGDLSAFTDAGEISAWAQEAMKWAVGSGLMNGKGNGIIDPKGTATRAEVAAMLQNFIENNKLVPPVAPGGDGGAGGTGGGWTQHVPSPQTGDSSNIGLWFSLMMASLASLVVLTVSRRRKNEDEETLPQLI